MGKLIATVSSGDIPAARGMVPYRLLDMADDGLGLLTALGVSRAHVVGASMGGMIAQTMALSSTERVLTLTSMMSSTGESEYGRPGPEAQAVLFSPKPADREGVPSEWKAHCWPALPEQVLMITAEPEVVAPF